MDLQFEMDKPNIIYYAHHMWKYDTKEEEEEIKLINNKFKNSVIINPNGWVVQVGNEEYIMEQCLQLVRNSSIIVFSSIEDGVIGKGVYDEVHEAYHNDLEIYYLNNSEFTRITYGGLINKFKIIVEETGTNRKYARVI